MHANEMSKTAFPNDAETIPLLDKVADLREKCARLTTRVSPASRAALAPLLRSMNSYYTNRIEGQHTFPADLEAAIEHKFSDQDEIHCRQILAIAYMDLEEALEPIALRASWAEQFTPQWIFRIHRDLSWIHPFSDGNGRVSRLQNHLLLAHLKLTNGLWSPMRGLARSQAKYHAALGEADQPRRNDTYGRGNLSSRGLTHCISFWLDACLDQLAFMSTQLDFESLEYRYNSFALQITHDFGRSMSQGRGAIAPEPLGRALYRLFQFGRLERGEFKAMLNAADRTASRMLAHLLDLRLVRSGSRVGPLEPGLPVFSLRFLFPGLWPEAENIPVPETDKASE
jgi:Fic family protein